MPAQPESHRQPAAGLLTLLDLTHLGEDDSPGHSEAVAAAARAPSGVTAALGAST